MATARISGNHWKLPSINGIDTIYEQSYDDMISEYAEHDAVIIDIDCAAMCGKAIHSIADKDVGYDAWDTFEELCDESDDWLADLYRKNYINDESE